MIITAINPQKKHPDRFNVFIDGSFSFSAEEFFITKFKLKEDSEISSEEISVIIKEAEFAKVYNRALAFISRRPHSQAEIIQYLKRLEVGEVTISMVLAKLKDFNFLNDREFAIWLIDQRTKVSARGKRAIVSELKQKGIDADLISELFDTPESASTEIESARALLSKKERQFSRFEPKMRNQKIKEFLARRGFSWDTIQAVLKFKDVIDENA